MADPELIDYIRKHLRQYGAETLRRQLIKDGVPAGEIEAALREGDAPPKPPKNRTALTAVVGGAVLIVLAGLLSLDKAPQKDAVSASKTAEQAAFDPLESEEGEIFRGHYGYMLKLPPDYISHQQFLDPQKTQERVFLYPKGVSSQHFIHEGIYGPMGIVRLDVVRRRIPQGFIGIETLKTWVTGKLGEEKATYTSRETMIQGMPAFIVNIEKPFKLTKAYIVGQKVRYEVTGGEENAVFTSIISSLYEASPHDRPGE